MLISEQETRNFGHVAGETCLPRDVTSHMSRSSPGPGPGAVPRARRGRLNRRGWRGGPGRRGQLGDQWSPGRGRLGGAGHTLFRKGEVSNGDRKKAALQTEPRAAGAHCLADLDALVRTGALAGGGAGHGRSCGGRPAARFRAGGRHSGAGAGSARAGPGVACYRGRRAARPAASSPWGHGHGSRPGPPRGAGRPGAGRRGHIANG